jgi:hypothetical protein
MDASGGPVCIGKVETGSESSGKALAFGHLELNHPSIVDGQFDRTVTQARYGLGHRIKRDGSSLVGGKRFALP